MICVTGPVLNETVFQRVAEDPLVLSMGKGDYLVFIGGNEITLPRADLKAEVCKYRKLPCSVLLVDGAYDDYDLLAEHPVFPWNGGMTQSISRGITRLLRGQIFRIDGKKVLVLGGARTPGRNEVGRYYDWWPEQDLTEHDIEEAERNLDKNGRQVDIILSVEHPSDWGGGAHGNPLLDGLAHSIDYGKWIFPVTDGLSGITKDYAVPSDGTVISLG